MHDWGTGQLSFQAVFGAVCNGWEEWERDHARVQQHAQMSRQLGLVDTSSYVTHRSTVERTSSRFTPYVPPRTVRRDGNIAPPTLRQNQAGNRMGNNVVTSHIQLLDQVCMHHPAARHTNRECFKNTSLSDADLIADLKSLGSTRGNRNIPSRRVNHTDLHDIESSPFEEEEEINEDPELAMEVFNTNFQTTTQRNRENAIQFMAKAKSSTPLQNRIPTPPPRKLPNSESANRSMSPTFGSSPSADVQKTVSFERVPPADPTTGLCSMSRHGGTSCCNREKPHALETC